MSIAPTSVGGAAQVGMVSPDFTGSWDEWFERVVGDLISRYLRGLGGMGGYGDASIGVPAPEDAGSYATITPGTDPARMPRVSHQTVMYWENYVRNFGAQDPFILANYGPPPPRRATFVPDPNAPASIQGTWAERDEAARREAEAERAHERGIAEAEIASRERIAGIQADVAREGFANQWRIATLEDATRRFVAEGDWGVQRYVAELREQGELTRLTMVLGDREKDRAQQAIFEARRHHEAMTRLALEVARYDAELAAQPRNWLKYAAWLRTRNVVVDGLTLAMASDLVPDEAIHPNTVAATTGSQLAAVQTAQEFLAGGAQGPGPQMPMDDGTAGPPLTQAGAGMHQQMAALPAHTPPPGPAQLTAAGTDYGALARNLLGMNPLQAIPEEASAQNLQAISQGLRTSPHTQQVPAFGEWAGPTTNALGMQITEPTGQKVNYSAFMRMLPSQQDMKLAEVESIGRWAPDFVKEMEAARPRGGARGPAAFG